MAQVKPKIYLDTSVPSNFYDTDKYFKIKLVPHSYPIDALHLACATLCKIDFLLTWNIGHMANPNKRKQLTDFNASVGLFIPQLTTPEELIKTYEQDQATT